MTDFDGTPLAMGSITGLRAWEPDVYGRLEGRYGGVWRPGENVAVCGRKCKDGIEERCTCGFYAYHTMRSLSRNERIAGVIRGYGIVLIGTEGFRCQKAIIVALYVANKDRRRSLQQLYPAIKFVRKQDHLLRFMDERVDVSPATMGDDFWTVGTKDLTKASGGRLSSGLLSSSLYIDTSPSTRTTTVSVSDCLAPGGITYAEASDATPAAQDAKSDEGEPS